MNWMTAWMSVSLATILRCSRELRWCPDAMVAGETDQPGWSDSAELV
jgi:hypothetical protein